MSRADRLAAALAALSSGADPRDVLDRVGADVDELARARLSELLDELAAARGEAPRAARADAPAPRPEAEVTREVERLLRRLGGESGAASG